MPRMIGVSPGMKMRRLGALLLGCCLLGLTQPTVAYESRGARSCAGWLEFRQDEKAGYLLSAEIYQTWLVGYLSGIVAGSGMDFLAGTDNETVFVMVDGYCDDNPQTNLAAAGTYIARTLMLKKGIVNRPTLP